MKTIRWGDHDRYFGPFTWSHSKEFPHWSVVLRSAGDGDDNSHPCSLRISLRKATLIVALPNIVRPHRTKVYPKSWDAETVKRLGRDWYWDIDPRQYGFSLSDGHLSVYYGRTGGPSCDSSIQQQWGCFLPWTQLRHVRHSFYGLRGEHLYDEELGSCLSDGSWEARCAREASVPTVSFSFKDFDDQELIATTKIEEREWRLGTGWFKWLSWFRRPNIRRSLSIEFSGETGPEKGSWKGGTIGTGIDMMPGELHEEAFRRYCAAEHRSKYRKYRITFLARTLAVSPRERDSGDGTSSAQSALRKSRTISLKPKAAQHMQQDGR